MTSTSATLTPALEPPPGVTPNFDNPESLYEENIVAQTFCLGLASILFFVRCFVRLGFSRVKREWIAEDWMVCLSYVGLVVYSALLTTMIQHRGGTHQWNLTIPEAQNILYYFWVESVVYGPFVYFTKVSILLMYKRIFVPHRYSLMWWTIYVFMGVGAMFYFAITVVKIWQCDPRARIWNKKLPGTCINVAALLQASGFFNTLSDALLLVIPVKSVWNLQMSIRKKFGVCVVFTIGAIAPVFSAIGFVVRVKTAASKDAAYNQPLILLWGTAEVTTGVICACLPCLPALVRHRRNRNPSGTDSYPRSRNSLTTRNTSIALPRASYFAGRPKDEYYELAGSNTTTSIAYQHHLSDDEQLIQEDHGIIKTVEIRQENVSISESK